MPAPLFQYVWQYNNQPIEVLAQDIVNIISGSGSGPVNTANYIPVSNGLTFENSWLYTVDVGNNDCLVSEFPSKACCHYVEKKQKMQTASKLVKIVLFS